MKMPKVTLGEILLGLSVIGLLTLMVVLGYERLTPPAVTFKGMMIENALIRSGEVMRVQAEARRRAVVGCTNGAQAEAKGPNGDVIRLPVPTRIIEGNISRYSIDMVDIAPGRYRLLLRETTFCSGSPDIAESNWTVFEVLS